jgi:hypothetical protein
MPRKPRVKTHRVPSCRCPKCGKELGRATETVRGQTPRPGCLSFCLECEAMLMFQDDMTLRLVTDAEQSEIMRSRQGALIMHYLAIIRRAKAECREGTSDATR